jgi:hypothetical protein
VNKYVQNADACYGPSVDIQLTCERVLKCDAVMAAPAIAKRGAIAIDDSALVAGGLPLISAAPDARNACETANREYLPL